MKQIILIVLSLIIFLGCEAEENKGTNKGGQNTTANIEKDIVTNRSTSFSEVTTGKNLQIIAVPVIKNGMCPAKYFSPRNKYCIPVDGAPVIYPRERNYPCPFGWSPQNKYCVASPNAKAIISQISACPSGWSLQHKYCQSGSYSSSLISRIRGYPCPSGWSADNNYCIGGTDAPLALSKRKDLPCPLGWGEQNGYCLIE